MPVSAERFYRHLYGSRVGLLALFSGHRTPRGELDKGSTQTRYFDYPARIGHALAYAAQESRSGREVWHCAHLLTKSRRVKENAAPVLTLWGDLDGAEVPNGSLKPTAVVESSPGRFHCYWRLSDEIPPEFAEGLNKRLARVAGADPSGFDLTQLLRVPDTANYKYRDLPVVTVLQLDGERSYSPRDLDKALPELEVKREPPCRDASDEPPVVLDEQALRVWRGEDPKLRDGKLDRSASLVKIGRELYDAGGNRPVIEAALEERDATLGWRCYADRPDAEVRYAGIVDELERTGRNGKAQIIVGTQRPNERDTDSSEEKEEKATQAQLLVRCADGVDLFHTTAGNSYVTVPVNDHYETQLHKAGREGHHNRARTRRSARRTGGDPRYRGA